MSGSELKRIGTTSKFAASGSFVNFLALGHKIKHPPVGVPANVMFVDIVFNRQYLPSNLYRYLPNITLHETKDINVMGIIALTDLEDDTELFVDYWNVYAHDASKVPDWMTIPPDNLGKLFVKRKYEHRIPLLLEVARETFAPEAIINRLDLDYIIQNEIKQLITPEIAEQKRRLEEASKMKLLTDKKTEDKK